MKVLRKLLVLFVWCGLSIIAVACNPQSEPVQHNPSNTASVRALVTGTPARSSNLPVLLPTGVPMNLGEAPQGSGEATQPVESTSSPDPGMPSATPTLSPRAWRTIPVIPTSIDPRMMEVYQLGQRLGNDLNAFSKVGDCQTTLPNFFGDFDTGKYDLGEYAYLQDVVEYFSGSFSRHSRGVKDGMTASGAMATLWNTWKDCNLQETPLECEYRINQPSFAIISLGTNDANGVVPFEDTLRRVIEVTLERGIVPILATKADNAEGDWSINETIVELAYEYGLPVWNFWRAVQPLPDRGLRSPEHLTYGDYTLTCDFSTNENLLYGYNARNLTGLQALDAVWRAVTGQPPSGFVPTPVSFLP